MSFELLQVQIALMDISYLNQHDRLFYKINEKINKIFIEPPVMLPQIPTELKFSGFPIVQATSIHGGLNLNISSNRIDILKTIKSNLVKPDLIIAQDLSKQLLSFDEIKPTRIGIVAQFINKVGRPQEIIKNILQINKNYSDLMYRFSVEYNLNKAKGKRLFLIQEAQSNIEGIISQVANISIDTNCVLTSDNKNEFQQLIEAILKEYIVYDVEGAFK